VSLRDAFDVSGGNATVGEEMDGKLKVVKVNIDEDPMVPHPVLGKSPRRS
jgi:hypothetical protein